MRLEPLLTAPLAVQVHAAAAMAAFALGGVQLLRPKGDGAHRAMGYMWVAAMGLAAASAFFIHEIDQWKGFSVIHLLAAYVLVMLPLAVLAARRGDVGRHRGHMLGMFFYGLVLAGALTMLPGRLLHKALFTAGGG